MRYQPGQKEEKRKALLKTSGGLVKKNGFAATGMDAIAQAADVTSGSFYSHFLSKADLLKALIESELLASREMWAGNPHQTAEDWILYELDRYLSMSHVRHPEAGCALPTLGAEIARADLSVRELYETELRKGQQVLASRLGGDDVAWAFISQLVGALLLARAMPTEKSQKAIIDASKRFLTEAIARMPQAPTTPSPRKKKSTD